MSDRSPQEMKPFKMSDDFKHLFTSLLPSSAYEALGLTPQVLIEKLEYAIDTASSFEQRSELQRLSDKRQFKSFLDLLKKFVQNQYLQNFISQTLVSLSSDSKAVQEFYAKKDGLNKSDEKETKAATITSSPIQPFKLDDNLKDLLIASLWSIYSDDPLVDPPKDINTLESEISRYSAEQQIALEPLNKGEHLIPFLQKLKSISKEDSFVARTSDVLLLSLQLDALSSPPTSGRNNTIKLPPLSNSGPDPDEGLYEYVEHDLYDTPSNSFPAYGNFNSFLQADTIIPQNINLVETPPSQPTVTTPQYTTPTVETNVTPQASLSSSSTPMADNKPLRHYDIPGSVARTISFTGTIGDQPAVKSAAPAEPGTKEKVEDLAAMFPPLPPDQSGNPHF